MRFQKQSFFQRTYIKTYKEEPLIVPLRKTSSGASFWELHPDNEFQWALKHVKAIKYAYFKAAFFFHYFPDIEKIILQNHTRSLISLNKTIYVYILKELGLYHKLFVPASRWIVPKFPLKRNRPLLWVKNSPYFQLFGNFVPDLSVLDLMMHYGQATRLYLKDNFILQNFKDYKRLQKTKSGMLILKNL